jgi:hypothetical protein
VEEPCDTSPREDPGEGQPDREGQRRPNEADAASPSERPQGPSDPGHQNRHRRERCQAHHAAREHSLLREQEEPDSRDDGGKCHREQVSEPLQSAEEVVGPLRDRQVVLWVTIPWQERTAVLTEYLDATEAPPEHLSFQRAEREGQEAPTQLLVSIDTRVASLQDS